MIEEGILEEAKTPATVLAELKALVALLEGRGQMIVPRCDFVKTLDIAAGSMDGEDVWYLKTGRRHYEIELTVYDPDADERHSGRAPAGWRPLES